MANTFEAIATVTVGSGGATTIDFTSIPATYTDLLLKISARDNFAAVFTDGGFLLTFNNSGSGYSSRLIYGVGSPFVAGSATSGSTDSARYIYATGASATASTFANAEIYIPNYASSNNKSVSADSVGENNGINSVLSLAANLWADSAAITSIKLDLDGGNLFVQYSTATLYGIKKN
jgi:hypothetical protein